MNYDEFIDKKAKFIYYKQRVDEITKRQPLHLLGHYEKRGPAGQSGKYHLDHIVSIRYGFDNGVAPEVIGDIRNLRFIPWKQNLSKSKKHVVESEEMMQYFIENGTIR